ncbi:MAG: transposase [Bacteroidales bacterium]|nr:transposase [Bacteroidales bacterium]
MKTLQLSAFKSIHSLVKKLNSEKKCRDFLAQIRWQGKTICPYCGCERIYNKKDGRYACSGCRNTFTVLVGTIFQNTKLPLIKWFMAIYLLCNNKQGISSCQLAKDLDITQKTAWFISQKIRILFKNPDDDFKDIIRSKITTKISLNGKVFRARIPSTPNLIHPNILKYIESGSRIFKDSYICYQSLAESERKEYQTEDPGWKLDESSRRIGKEDGFWLQIKRMTLGVYHYISAAIFHRYVYEAIFRRSTTGISNADRAHIMLSRIGQVVTYKTVRPT